MIVGQRPLIDECSFWPNKQGGEKVKNIRMDIGKKRCFTCVMDDDGVVLEEGSYNTQCDAARLERDALRRQAPGRL